MTNKMLAGSLLKTTTNVEAKYSWMQKAECNKIGSSCWDYLTSEQQIETCNTCPVQLECREWNDAEEKHSTTTAYWVFGGETPETRMQRRIDNGKKEYCSNGHERTEENQYFWGPEKDKRQCRLCRAANMKRYKERQSAKKKAKLAEKK